MVIITWQRMINVDPLSHFPIFLQGIWTCNKNPAGTHSLLFICYSIPWDAAEHSHPAKLPQKRAVMPAGATCPSSLPGSSGTTTENKQMEGMSQKPVEILTVRWQKPLQADKISCPTWNKRCTRASYIYIRSLANFAETTCGCSSSLLPAGHTGTWCSDFR